MSRRVVIVLKIAVVLAALCFAIYVGRDWFRFSLVNSPSILADLPSKSMDDLVRLRDTLLPVRGRSSHLLLVMTLVVTGGVAFEGFEIYLDTRKEIRVLRGQADVDATKFHSWAKLAGTLGWLVIVFGLVGEYVAEARISSDDTTLEAVNDTILAKTQSAANSAQKSAELARDAAANAQAKADKASASADRAKRDAGQVRDELMQARDEAKAAEFRLEKEQQKTARQQKEAAEKQEALYGLVFGAGSGRTIVNLYLDALKGLPPAPDVNIFFVDPTAKGEPAMFARLIWVHLIDAGWQVPDPRPWTGTEIQPGVVIFNSQFSRPKSQGPSMPIPGGLRIVDALFLMDDFAAHGLDWAKSRRLAFLTAGLAARMEEDAKLSGDSIRIVVGVKEPAANK